MLARKTQQSEAMSSVISKPIIEWMNRQKRQHYIYLRSKTLKWLLLTCPFRFLFPKILTCRVLNLARGQGNTTSRTWYIYRVIFVLVWSLFVLYEAQFDKTCNSPPLRWIIVKYMVWFETCTTEQTAHIVPYWDRNWFSEILVLIQHCAIMLLITKQYLFIRKIAIIDSTVNSLLM